jgi:hypothetical protein
MWQFSEVVDGISEACRALDIPVIGGNVSFYNESRGADIDPTPIVGVIGLVDSLDSVPPGIGLGGGDGIVVLGETRPELGGSEWATRHGLRAGRPPVANLDLASRVHDLVRALVNERVVHGVHDCSDGARCRAGGDGDVAHRLPGEIGGARLLRSPRRVSLRSRLPLDALLGAATRIPAAVGRAGGDGWAGRVRVACRARLGATLSRRLGARWPSRERRDLRLTSPVPDDERSRRAPVTPAASSGSTAPASPSPSTTWACSRSSTAARSRPASR